MNRCDRPDCGGELDSTGYCPVCLMPPLGQGEPAEQQAPEPVPAPRAPNTPDTPAARTGRAAPPTVRATTAGDPWWALDLVTPPDIEGPDAATAVQSDLRIPEEHRKCSACEKPVGVGVYGQPSLLEGRCPHDGTRYSFVPRLHEGDLVAERYEVRGCLNYGGTGWVYLAYDRHLDDQRGRKRPVALKGVIRAADRAAREAAREEMRFLTTLGHPDIVEIHDFATHTPDSGDGLADSYIVMEYVPGHPLTAAVPGLRTEHIAAYVLRVLGVMHYLHENGYLYCDMKPGNLMVSGSGVKVIDLGAVRRAGAPGPGSFTKEYAAPELHLTGPTVATDLYTVGRTLEDLRDWYSQGGESATSLSHLIARATHPDPAGRFGSAAEMAGQLSGVLRELAADGRGAPGPAPSMLFGRATSLIDKGLGAVPSPESWMTEGAQRAAGDGDCRWLTALPPAPVTAAAGLPEPLPDGSDPAAEFLTTQVSADPEEADRQLAQYQDRSPEVELAHFRVRLRLGKVADARAALNAVWPKLRQDWRKNWHGGLLALVDGRSQDAELAFTACYQSIPGESAPRLALALCAEYRAQRDEESGAVGERYLAVWRSDVWCESAAFGLARVRARLGDRVGAVSALDEIPYTSRHYPAAQTAAVRVLAGRLGDGASGLPGPDDLADAERRVRSLGLDASETGRLALSIAEARLARACAVPGDAGRPGTEREIRLLLEREYRTLARGELDERRYTILVDLANAVRPRTLS